MTLWLSPAVGKRDHLQCTRWCSHSNAQASSDDSRASLAASKCSLIRNACQSYFDPGFNLSKSLCSGTSGNCLRTTEGESTMEGPTRLHRAWVFGVAALLGLVMMAQPAAAQGTPEQRAACEGEHGHAV